VHTITADVNGDATSLMENVGYYRQSLDERRGHRRDPAQNEKQALGMRISVIGLMVDINHHLGQRRHERATIDARRLMQECADCRRKTHIITPKLAPHGLSRVS
jgi:hypothetical protein